MKYTRIFGFYHEANGFAEIFRREGNEAQLIWSGNCSRDEYELKLLEASNKDA